MQNGDGCAGYKWLSEAYEVAPVQPLRVRSVIGSARSSAASNGFTVETYLLRYDTARDSLKEIIEGRDEDYATIIRSLVTNMTVSAKLRKTYPGVFSDDELAKRIERVVFKAFELLPDDDDEVVPRLDVLPR